MSQSPNETKELQKFFKSFYFKITHKRLGSNFEQWGMLTDCVVANVVSTKPFRIWGCHICHWDASRLGHEGSVTKGGRAVKSEKEGEEKQKGKEEEKG